MKPLTTSMILSVVFLSAGAFSGASGDQIRFPKAASVTSQQNENITVVGKNRSWPPAGHISMEPCAKRRCIDV